MARLMLRICRDDTWDDTGDDTGDMPSVAESMMLHADEYWQLVVAATAHCQAVLNQQ